MLKRRIIYIIWWIILLSYLFFRADIISIMLIIFTLLITIATSVAAYFASKKITACLSKTNDFFVGEKNSVGLEVSNTSHLPVFTASALVSCLNKNKENKQCLNVGFYLGIKEKTNIEIDIKCSDSGELLLSIDELCIMDFFGVICFKKRLDDNAEKLELFVKDREEASDERGFVSGSEETKTEYEKEDSVK